MSAIPSSPTYAHSNISLVEPAEINTETNSSNRWPVSAPHASDLAASTSESSRRESEVKQSMDDLKTLEANYWNGHMKISTRPLSKALTSRKNRVPPAADLAYTADQLILHKAIAGRYQELAASKDPQVEKILNFSFKGGRFEHMIKVEELKEDLASRGEF